MAASSHGENVVTGCSEAAGTEKDRYGTTSRKGSCITELHGKASADVSRPFSKQ